MRRKIAAYVAIAVVCLTAMGGLATGSATARPAFLTKPGARVVIIAVPGLRWSDVEHMPLLRALAAHSAVADLSVKTQPSSTRCAGALLAFSAGERVEDVRDVGGGCRLSPSELSVQRRANAGDRYGARIGALGDALHGAGLRTEAVGDLAVPIVADSTGRVDTQNPENVAATASVAVAAFVDDQLYEGRIANAGLPPTRQQLADVVDGEISRALDRVGPLHPVVVVAGISDAASGGPHAHALIISGSGWPAGTLSSGTTHRRPWVQLIDLAPTVLSMVHVPVPADMAGRPVHFHRGTPPSPSRLADDDRHARKAMSAKFWTVSGICLLALLGIAALVVGRRRIGQAAIGSAIAASLLSYLAQLTPWWRLPLLAFLACLGAAALLVTCLVTWLAGRHPFGVTALPAAVATLLAVDQLAGAPLQLSAPLGDNPLVAGRFHGMGNIAFALFAAAALLAAALVGGHLANQDPRWRPRSVILLIAIGVVVAVIDGAPSLGDDLGGLLTLPVAIVVAAFVFVGARLTVRRVSLAVGAGIAVAVAVAAADYSRSAAHQTHLGRFFGQVLHGGAGHVISRKADAVLHSVGNVTVTGLVIVVVLVAIGAGRERLRDWSTRLPGLGAGWAAAAVIALVGSLINDSGIVIAAMAIVAGLLPPLAAPTGIIPR